MSRLPQRYVLAITLTAMAACTDERSVPTPAPSPTAEQSFCQHVNELGTVLDTLIIRGPEYEEATGPELESAGVELARLEGSLRADARLFEEQGKPEWAQFILETLFEPAFDDLQKTVDRRDANQAHFDSLDVLDMFELAPGSLDCPGSGV